MPNPPKITLQAWAESRYSPPPSVHTLRRWVRESGIYPPPERVGKCYYVDPGAVRLVKGAKPMAPLVDRLIALRGGR